MPHCVNEAEQFHDRRRVQKTQANYSRRTLSPGMGNPTGAYWRLDMGFQETAWPRFASACRFPLPHVATGRKRRPVRTSSRGNHQRPTRRRRSPGDHHADTTSCAAPSASGPNWSSSSRRPDRRQQAQISCSQRLTRPHTVIAGWLAEHYKRKQDPWLEVTFKGAGVHEH